MIDGSHSAGVIPLEKSEPDFYKRSPPESDLISGRLKVDRKSVRVLRKIKISVESRIRTSVELKIRILIESRT